MNADGIFLDVMAVGFAGCGILHAEFFEAVLPYGHFRFEAEGETSFDELHGFLDGDIRGRRKEEVDVVRHEDERVESVAALGAVVAQELEEQVCVRVRLEDTAAIRGDGGDEEGAQFGRERDGHEGRLA